MQLKQLRKESVKFNLSPEVQIYVSNIHIHLFILHGYITNSQYDQLPVGLIAQLVGHCTGIAEVMDSNPVQAWIVFRLSFRNCLSCVNNREGLSSHWFTEVNLCTHLITILYYQKDQFSVKILKSFVFMWKITPNFLYLARWSSLFSLSSLTAANQISSLLGFAWNASDKIERASLIAPCNNEWIMKPNSC